MLSALIDAALSYPAMLLVEQLVHQRCVQLGPLVLKLTPLKFPIVHSGYNPNCLTHVYPTLLLAWTISSSLAEVLLAKELTFDPTYRRISPYA